VLVCALFCGALLFSAVCPLFPEEVRSSYTELNTRLMFELGRLWESDRVRAMGPIMQTFIAQEKKVAEAYLQALNQIKITQPQ